MISAIVLTHNDEKIVGKCLESLNWCDEVIVVDDFSNDKTVQVVQKFGVKAYERHLNADFASQRSYGLQMAKGDWVLFVDSDEVVSVKLAEEIESRILNNESGQKANGYYLKRRDWMWGRCLKHGETNRVRLLRLARKEAGVWRRPIHEVWQVSGKTGELKNPLLHYPHPNVAQFLEEINWYSSLNANYLFEHGVRINGGQIIAYPLAKFFLNYFWRLGCLDGTAGIVMALMMSFHSFLTRAKLWTLTHKP